LSEVEEDSESENKYPIRNHFDSLKADFEQEDVEDWSDEENDGEMDELFRCLMHAQLKSYGGLSTALAGLWKLQVIGPVSQAKQLLGL